MFEIYEEIDNQKKNFDLQQGDFIEALMNLKNVIDIANKKNALGLVNGVKENLVKLANGYIDSMLNKLSEKQTKEEIEKNRVIVSLLTKHIQDPNIPLSGEVITAIADEHREEIAKSISSMVKDMGEESRVLKWLGEMADV